MIHTIESEALHIEVSNTGAELQSILSKKTGVEYLWQGDPAYWGSRAPILFPIVGGLKEGVYTFDGHTYPLQKHGFVRLAHFHRVDGLTGGSPDSQQMVFEYTDNQETRLVYPFSFTLSVRFMVQENSLVIENRVVNQSSGSMLFSIGAHEAYRCPRSEEETFDDYFIKFDRDGHYESSSVSDRGLLTDEPYSVIQNGRILPLKHDLFVKDALIFQNIQSRKLAIKSKKSDAVIEVGYDAPHLLIWTKVGAPFVCIEPWHGLPDHENGDGMLVHKSGIITLTAGAECVFKHSITIIET